MLKVLPEKIYNLIAAGEVIGRPASVVKELLENSADAGATSITLIINDYGKTLIQVIDNGSGMDREEAQLCFLSHATSKIEEIEDIEKITTFGFRGEALASIAACSEVTLKTRKRGEDIGTEVKIASSKIEECKVVSTPQGCNIAVRNLFYNIPARRKFLKSDNWEYQQILNEFIRVALTRLEIGFKLISNSKEIYNLQPLSSLKQRIAELNNTSHLKISKELIDISVDTSIVKISGCIGTPNSAKKRQNNTLFFANGRFFKSHILHKAVINGYSNIIQEGYIPSYYIFLEVPNGELDVNISPSKTEIKFENEQAIFQILEASIKESIGKNAFAPIIDFNTDGVPQEITSGDGFTLTQEERENYTKIGIRKPKIDYDPLFNPFEERKSITPHSNCTLEEGTTPIYKENNKFLIIDNNTIAFVDSQTNSVNILNITRAKERIFYEQYLKSIYQSNVAIQQELFPTTLTLNEPLYNILIENKEYLANIGFEIREFGKNCIAVSGTPAHFNGEKFSIEECVEEIAEQLLEEKKEIKIESIALNIIKHTNFSMKIAPTAKFIEELLYQLESCSQTNISPKGGYIMFGITQEEIKNRLL